MKKVLGFSKILLLATSFFLGLTAMAQPQYNAVGDFFNEVCSACHGSALEGTNLGTPLVGVDLANGEQVEQIMDSIAEGNLEAGMPPYGDIYDEGQIQSLAIYVTEQRAGFDYDSYQMRESVSIPTEVQQSQLHNFQLTTLSDEVDPLPYSLTPMPDGSTLVVEKKFGLRVLSANGELSDLISGTPKTWDDSSLPEGLRALDRGKGWMQDVVLHPNYESNGWIYIYMGDRCDYCNEISREQNRPVGMTKIVRGQIQDGAWVNEETLWTAGYENYTTNTDLAIGGRATFDDKGYFYFTIGAMNGFYDAEIQNLARPWGKIHRIHEDGRIPADNPFVDIADAIPSIWTVGHRAPQGLEYDSLRGILWGTEHGPRGGDEVNNLLPGGNYGWPLTSRGVDYDGSPVEGKVDIEFNIEDIEQPIVDMTPSPALSAFVVYRGEQFPEWQGDIISGSLKAQSLYRFEIEDGQLVEKETLIQGIGRIRDVEVDRDGYILLLSENAAGSKVLKMGPAN